MLSPEEWVRQHCLQYLLKDKNYPKSHLNVEKQLKLAELETAQAEGHPMHPQAVAGYQRVLTNPNSSFNSSMYRDMRAGLPIEGEHLVGDMVRRANKAGVSCSLLTVALAALQTYSARLV